MTKRSDSPCGAGGDESGEIEAPNTSGYSSASPEPVTSAEVSLSLNSTSSSTPEDAALIRPGVDSLMLNATSSASSSPIQTSHEEQAPSHAIQSIMQTLVNCTDKYLNDNVKYEPI